MDKYTRTRPDHERETLTEWLAQRSGSATLRPRTGSCRRFKHMTHIESAMLGLSCSWVAS